MTNHEAHIALWDYLAKNPGKTKEEWPYWPMHQNVIDYSRCFACFDCDLDCDYCPLQWGEDRSCRGNRSLYWAYRTASGKKRKNLAKQIRDLEWKDER